MDNRAGTSVIVRILPGPEDVLDGDLTAVSAPRLKRPPSVRRRS
jgi:hypothetical protein